MQVARHPQRREDQRVLRAARCIAARTAAAHPHRITHELPHTPTRRSLTHSAARMRLRPPDADEIEAIDLIEEIGLDQFDARDTP